MPVSKKPIRTELTVPQWRILETLYKLPVTCDGEPGELTRDQIAKKARVSPSMTGNLGPITSDPAETTKKYRRTNLIHAGFVERRPVLIVDTGVTEQYYRITEAGKEAWEEHIKEVEAE